MYIKVVTISISIISIMCIITSGTATHNDITKSYAVTVIITPRVSKINSTNILSISLVNLLSI